MKYRNRAEISRDMLTAIQNGGKDGVRITKLTVKTNTSFNQIEKYANMLATDGLITIEKKPDPGHRRVVYKMTPKGQDFLDAYNCIESLAPSLFSTEARQEDMNGA